MRSMTGFGQAAGETDRWRVTVTLRAVNHRFLDLSLRLRDEYRAFEPALRQLLVERLERGRLEATVEIVPLAEPAGAVEIDEGLVAELHGRMRELAARGLVAGELTVADLLRAPQLVTFRVRDPAWTPADQERWLAVTAQALDELVAARVAEGEKLAAVLAVRRRELEQVVDRLREQRTGVTEQMARSLRERVAELLAGTELDPDRLVQEVALMAERSDVSEELDRLGSHLEHFHAVMAQPGSIGKRLDFLAQEILRELNTVGSKCRDGAMIRTVLDGKVLCEQLREQVQNVE